MRDPGKTLREFSRSSRFFWGGSVPSGVMGVVLGARHCRRPSQRNDSPGRPEISCGYGSRQIFQTSRPARPYRQLDDKPGSSVHNDPVPGVKDQVSRLAGQGWNNGLGSEAAVVRRRDEEWPPCAGRSDSLLEAFQRKAPQPRVLRGPHPPPVPPRADGGSLTGSSGPATSEQKIALRSAKSVPSRQLPRPSHRFVLALRRRSSMRTADRESASTRTAAANVHRLSHAGEAVPCKPGCAEFASSGTGSGAAGFSPGVASLRRDDESASMASVAFPGTSGFSNGSSSPPP
jgi:hypothetical protein